MNMVKPTHCTDLCLSTLNPPMLKRGVCARVCEEATNEGCRHPSAALAHARFEEIVSMFFRIRQMSGAKTRKKEPE